MTLGESTALIGVGAVAAGFVGALTGLGGGVVLVPVLTIVLGVDLRYAIGASLVAVIATSSAAAAAYVRDGWSNLRVGMFLEVATTLGALCGAALAAVVSPSAVAVVFGVVLLVTALAGGHGAHAEVETVADPLGVHLRLDGTYPGPTGPVAYHVTHVPLGWAIMFVAGALSGLLGIGSGALKVLAMDRAMRLPFKVSTTTSNFMIGVTAAASAGVYLHRGYVDPGLAVPVLLGVLLGATLGARLLATAPVTTLRRFFTLVLLALGVEMLWHGLSRSFHGL